MSNEIIQTINEIANLLKTYNQENDVEKIKEFDIKVKKLYKLIEEFTKNENNKSEIKENFDQLKILQNLVIRTRAKIKNKL